MKKLLDIGPYFANTYEPSFQLLDLYNPQQLTKTASEIESGAYKYAATMSPKEGHTFILVIAMGAYEFYGPNKNGDGFNEKDLKLQYKNFETTYKKNPKTGEDEIDGGALLYKHHKNKVAKGHPWFGTVHKAFYNDRMHRVELIIDIHHNQPGAMELVDKVHGKQGSFSVSMGVNIPYDTCAVCHNKASKQEDYCPHLKYELGKTRDDGTRVYAINGGYDYNKYPRALNFFDISYVFRPADKTGYMLKKVANDPENFEEVVGSAEAYNKLASLQEKSAQLKKMADITKYFEGVPFAKLDAENNPQLQVINRNPQIFENVISQMQELTPEHYEKLSKYPMGEILASLSDLGIILTTPEFIKMVVYKKSGKHLDLLTLKQACKDQSAIFEELAENPEMVNELLKNSSMFSENHQPKDDIKDIVSDIKESRDLSEEGFAKKATVSPLRSVVGWNDPANVYAGDTYGMHHIEHVTDPTTGKNYTASMAAIDEAKRQQATKNALKILGGAGLLAGTYAYLRSQKSKILAPALGIGALALGAKMLYDKGRAESNTGNYTSASGMDLPRNTAFFTKESADTGWLSRFANKAGPGSRTIATFAPGAGSYVGHKYYENRLKSGKAGTYRTALEKHMDNLGRVAYEHPFLTAAGGMAAGHTTLNALSGLRKLFRR